MGTGVSMSSSCVGRLSQRGHRVGGGLVEQHFGIAVYRCYPDGPGVAGSQTGMGADTMVYIGCSLRLVPLHHGGAPSR